MHRYSVVALLSVLALSAALPQEDFFHEEETFVQPIIFSDYAEELNTLLAETSKK